MADNNDHLKETIEEVVSLDYLLITATYLDMNPTRIASIKQHRDVAVLRLGLCFSEPKENNDNEGKA